MNDLELVDAICKGGPGSGPHAGVGRTAKDRTRAAHAASAKANASGKEEDHRTASAAHRDAENAHLTAESKDPGQGHKDQADLHGQMAQNHARSARLAHYGYAKKGDIVTNKDLVNAIFKGGPGSGPHPGGGGAKNTSRTPIAGKERGQAHRALLSAGFKHDKSYDRGVGIHSEFVSEYSHPEGHIAEIRTSGMGQKGHMNIQAPGAVHGQVLRSMGKK